MPLVIFTLDSRITMNLQTTIGEELWASISAAYDGERFTHAILEALHHLSNVLRDRAGVDGDGAALVGC